MSWLRLSRTHTGLSLKVPAVIVPPQLRALGTTALALIAVASLGFGIVVGWQWWGSRQDRKAVEAIPAIKINTEALRAEAPIVAQRQEAYKASSSDFRSSARITLANPATSPQAAETIKKGQKAVTDADSLQKAKDSTITLLTRRDTLLTNEAVRARRGDRLRAGIAAGYEPIYRAPALRLSVEVKLSGRWSAIASYDAASKYIDHKVNTQRSAFVGMNYQFGGRR